MADLQWAKVNSGCDENRRKLENSVTKEFKRSRCTAQAASIRIFAGCRVYSLPLIVSALQNVEYFCRQILQM